MVVLLTNKDDITADYVVLELRERQHECLRLNFEDLLETEITCRLPLGNWTVRKDGALISHLEHQLTGVWYRRPEPIQQYRGEQLPLEVSDFVNDQWRQVIYGLLSIPGVTWVNDPFANSRSECKILQLVRAARLGFEVPETVVTNSPESFAQLDQLVGDERVAKALYSPLIHGEDGSRFIYTTPLPRHMKTAEHEIRLSPTIYQRSLSRKTDIRATVVGGEVFAAALDRPTAAAAPIDWRQSPTPTAWVPVDLEPRLTQRLVRLVESLGLVFGAVDLVESDGRHYFLEVNPNGEWGWLQASAGLPIAAAIVDVLTRAA